ncbi:MAG TPA: hypothetical protein VMU41_07740 [Candidatus Binataceae bacterium]|nr:hypothetical protein [Candidatus Binataceae bacterium]
MEVPDDRPPHTPDQAQFPWRGAVFAAATVALIATATALYNTGRQIPGLAALGFGFAVPMVWLILAAHQATDADSNVRRFIPRLMIWMVVGSAFLGIFWWNLDRRVSLMEAGFGAFYIVAGLAAIRIFDAKGRRPTLTAVGGRNRPRRPNPNVGGKTGRRPTH